MNDFARLIYNDKMGMENKQVLYKKILKPILIYCALIWDSVANSNIEKIQVVRNKVFKGIRKAA